MTTPQPDSRQIKKLFRAYDKAEYELAKKRDELFPAGTRVRSSINPELTVEVVEGSLYPHQVKTTYGHMSWRYLEVVNTETESQKP